MIALPGAVLACVPVESDASVSQRADCSYINAGHMKYEHGLPAVDLGDARVLQIVRDGEEGQYEVAVISDCRQREMVRIPGKATGWATSCGEKIEIVNHLQPEGDLDLTVGTNLTTLISYVQGKGFSVGAGVHPFPDMDESLNLADAQCGCELFYPEPTQ